MKRNLNRNLRWLLFPLLVPLGAVFFSLSSANLSADEPTPTELALALIDAGKITQGQKALEQIAQTNEPSALVALFEFHRAGFFTRTDHDLAKRYLMRAVQSGDQIARWRWANTERFNGGKKNSQMLMELFKEDFEVATCDLKSSDIGLSEAAKAQICSDAMYALAAGGNDRAIYNLWVAEDPRYEPLVKRFAPLRLVGALASHQWDNNPTKEDLSVLISALKLGGIYSAVLIAHNFDDHPSRIVEEQDRLLKLLDETDRALITNTLIDLAKGDREGWFIDHKGAGFLAAIFRHGRAALNIAPDWGIAYNLYADCGEAFEAGFCEYDQGVLINNGGPSLVPDRQRGLEHFFSAHQLGVSEATLQLGHAYMYGRGVPMDLVKAGGFYKEAINRGNLDGAFDLAQLYLDGTGVEQDDEIAAELYSYAANYAYEETGDPWAMIMLGVMHENKLLPDSDMLLALQWFRRATVDNPLYERSRSGEPNAISYQDVARAGVDRVTDKVRELELSTASVDFGSYKALLVANENYHELDDLKTPSKDVILIGEILESRFGAQVEYLIDARRSDLLSKLSEYRRELGPQDNFILYYAGHGIYDEELDAGYWQLSDAKAEEDYSWVETDRVSRTLSAFKSRNAMIIADSCYSGSVVRGTALLGDFDNLPALKSLNAKKSRVAITSGGLQPVLDSNGSSEHSSFAKNFAAALENVRGPTPASVLFTDLRTAVSTETAAWGFEQVPEFAPLYRAGHDGGDFIFSPVPK